MQYMVALCFGYMDESYG